MTESAHILTATPKLIERVHYAIQRCKERPSMTSTAIDAEIVAQFGRSISTSQWVIINAARRANALDQIVVKAFDASKHGRNARMGKTKEAVSQAKSAAPKASRHAKKPRARGTPAATTLRPNPSHHPKYTIAVWKNGATTHHPAHGKDDARKLVAKLIDDGVPLPDIAVYALEPLEVSFAIRL